MVESEIRHWTLDTGHSTTSRLLYTRTGLRVRVPTTARRPLSITESSTWVSATGTAVQLRRALDEPLQGRGAG